MWRAEWSDRRGFGDWLEAWREAQEREGADDIGSTPQWCRGLEASYPGSLRWVRLQSAGAASVVPLLLRPSAVDCRLGEVRILHFRPRLLRLTGQHAGIPEDPAAYEAFLRSLLTHREEWDAICFTLPTTSALARWLGESDVHAIGLVRYQPQAGVVHHLLELPASFRDYAAKFTGNTRRNRERELRYLEQLGSIELRCYRRPDEAGTFLAAAETIARETYQHQLLRCGLLAAEGLGLRLTLAAQQGWLRAYLLCCGGAPCSFLLGYQYHGCYYHESVGYDPKWAKWRVGTALHWLALQDMFLHDRPRVIDLGPDAAYKRYFGNRQYEETTIYLFRRSLYGWLLRKTHQASLQLSESLSSALARWGIKVQAQRAIRRLRGC